MRDETRRKLDVLRRSERRRVWLLAALGVAGMLALAVFAVRRPPASVRELEAVVRVAIVQNDLNSGQRYMTIESQLDNGKIVLAAGLQAQPPRPGDRIVLTERTDWPGFYSYEWNGLKR